jgi:SAM-dependent methyltransferase
MDLKEKYALNHSKETEKSLYLNKRLFSTYNRIIIDKYAIELNGVNIDLGSGDKGFSKYCQTIGIKSYPYDYPEFNIEKDILPHNDNCIDFVTMNAVIEHIEKPDHIFKEIKRVLKKNGFVFIRTPNWQMDYKNFYNDPTHKKPYAPATLKNALTLFGFDTIFLEPGLIEKSLFWWKLPNSLKWKIASLLKGGTKSILCVAKNNMEE